MKLRHLAVIAIATVLTFPTVAALAQDFPRYSNHVVDDADILPDDAEDRLNAELASFQQRSGHQIAVAIVETTGKASLEDYTNDLFDEWGVGSAEEDDGVLLLIAYEDRKLRIEVGYGLEGELTDLESGRIIREIISPHMADGDPVAAVTDGTRAIRAVLGDEGVEMPIPAEPSEDEVPAWAFIIPLLIFGPLSAFGRRRGRRRGWLTPVIWGGLGGIGSGRSGGGGFSGGFGGGGGGGSGGGGASGGW